VFYGRGVFELLGKYNLRYRIWADYAINVEAFCDDRIEKKYVDLVIAEYEGAGISEMNEDDIFIKDLPALARRCLGVSQLITPDPFFSILMRLRFNAPLQALARRARKVYTAAKRLFASS
jgi:hypothetical protein